MTVYFSVLLILSFLFIFSSAENCQPVVRQATYIVAAVILTLVSGLRYLVGTDYVQYISNYSSYLTNFSIFSQPALSIVAKISSFIYNDYATWFFLMAVITVVPVMVMIIKRNKNVELAILLYVLIGCWHFSFNIVKQSAAATILFCGYNFLKERKFWQWCIVCLIASTFHVSAVLMVPAYFLAGNKIDKKRIIILIAAAFIISLSYDKLFYLIAILKKGEGLVNEYSDTANQSVNILRIIVNCMPVLVYFVFRKVYENAHSDDFICLLNLSILNAVMNIASMGSIYLNRICCYTNIFNILFIPLLFPSLKPEYKKIKPIVMTAYMTVIFLYFIFWSYDLYKGSDTVNYYWIFER